MLLVGLTGGIGSGKSTVAALLAGLGCHVIDADAIARGLLAPGGAALDEVLDVFGRDLLGDDGTLDRRRLAARVFEDDAARGRLEAITHPRIAAAIRAELDRLAGHVPTDTIVVVEHPLLVETGQAADYDALVVVVSDDSTRIARVVEQRGLSPDEVRARIRVQADDDARRAVATHVVVNDGTPAALAERVGDLHTGLAHLASVSA